ncbi:unnamed protein product, partial [Ectocarpus sp. 13 AM-2016]
DFSRISECILNDNSHMVLAFFRNHETDEESLKNMIGRNMYLGAWRNITSIFMTKTNVVSLQKINERVNLLASIARGQEMTTLFHFKTHALYYIIS